MSSKQLRQLAADGKINRDTPVRLDGTQKHKQAGKIQGLFDQQAAHGPDPVPAATPAVEPFVATQESAATGPPPEEQSGGPRRLSYIAIGAVAAALLISGVFASSWFRGVNNQTATDLASADPSSSSVDGSNTNGDHIATPEELASLSPPTGLPESLPPLEAPDLAAMVVEMNLQPEIKKLPPRTEIATGLPQSFSGVADLNLGANPNDRGFYAIDLEISQLGKHLPPKRKLTRKEIDRQERQEKYATKTRGQDFAGYYVGLLPESYSGHAREVSGTLTLSRVRDESLRLNDANNIAEKTEELKKIQIAGWYDPFTHTVSLWEKGRQNAGFTLSGYWLPEEKLISGWSGSAWDHFFISSDPQRASQFVDLAVALKRPAPEQPRRPSARRSSGARRSPRSTAPPVVDEEYQRKAKLTAQIAKWYPSLEKDLASTAYEKTLVGDVFFLSMRIFAEEDFANSFGVPIEQLGHENRRALVSALREALGRRQAARDPQKGTRYSDYLIRDLYQPLEDKKFPMLMSFVANYRGKKSWAESYLQRLSTSAAYDGAFEDLRQASPWLKLAMQGQLATETASAHASLEAAISDRAAAQLAAWDIRIPDGSTNNEFDQLLAAVPPEAAEAARAGLASLNRAGDVRSLMGDYAKLARIRDDKDAIFKVHGWLNDLTSRNRTLQTLPIYAEVFRYANKRHFRLLKSYAPYIAFRVETAGSTIAAKEYASAANPRGQFSNLPESIAATNLIANSLQRKQWAEELSKFSPQERGWILENSTRIEMPNTIPEPTEESIRKAVVREWSRIPGCERFSSNEFAFSTPPMRLVGQKFIVSVRKAEKLVNSSGQAAVETEDGFICAFKLTMKIHGDIPGPLKSIAGAPGDQVFSAPRVEEFVLTESGWRSPSLRSRALEGIANSTAQAISSFGGGLQTLPPGYRYRTRVFRQR